MKKDLILLHGALGSAVQFSELESKLSDKFNCFTLDFLGHGSATETLEMSIELFVNQLLEFTDQHGLESPVVFGYSMGGYVALAAASKLPQSFSKIVTLGTKFAWSEEIASNEIRMINPDKIQEKVPKFAYYLKQIHDPTDWKKMMFQTQELMLELGRNPNLNDETLSKIKIPVDLNIGSLDTMVTIEETNFVANSLSHVTVSVLPNVSHPIQQINVGILEALICEKLG